MRSLIYVILLLTIFGSCDIGNYGYFATEADTEFGKHLILIAADTLGVHQWDDGTVTQHKGMFIEYQRVDNIDTLFIWQNTTVIRSHINNVKSDGNYIIIDQKPLNLIFGEIDYKQSSPRRPNWPGNAGVAKKMLKKSPLHRYWIINKNTKTIYGGYEKEMFDSICIKLNIPTELSF